MYKISVDEFDVIIGGSSCRCFCLFESGDIYGRRGGYQGIKDSGRKCAEICKKKEYPDSVCEPIKIFVRRNPICPIIDGSVAF